MQLASEISPDSNLLSKRSEQWAPMKIMKLKTRRRLKQKVAPCQTEVSQNIKSFHVAGWGYNKSKRLPCCHRNLGQQSNLPGATRHSFQMHICDNTPLEAGTWDRCILSISGLGIQQRSQTPGFHICHSPGKVAMSGAGTISIDRCCRRLWVAYWLAEPRGSLPNGFAQ